MVNTAVLNSTDITNAGGALYADLAQKPVVTGYNSGTLVVSGTGVSGAVVTVFVDGVAEANTATVDGSGNWNITLSTAPNDDNPHSITAKQTYVPPSRASTGLSLTAAWSFSNLTSATGGYIVTDVNSTPVSIWQDRSSASDLVQWVSGNKPTFATGKVTFDGVDDFLEQTHRATFVSATELPDASGGVAGKGFTCTGLWREADGTWWVGNYGRRDEGDVSTFASSVVQLSSNFTTKIREILSSNISPTLTNIQGVTGAPDGTLWLASPADSKIYNISKAGSGSLINTFTMANAPNGIAWDSLRGELIVGRFTAPNLDWVNPTTGAVTQSILLQGGVPDHLYFDASEGSQGTVYYTWDDGHVGKFDVARQTLLRQWVLLSPWVSTQADCIEGIWKEGNTLYLANDGYFHSGSPRLNRILQYTIDTSTPDLGNRVLIAGVARQVTTQANYRTLFAMGRPSRSTSKGVNVYIPPNSSSILGLGVNGTNTEFGSLTLGSTFIYVFDVNTAAKTVSLYINSAHQGSPTNNAATGAMPPGVIMMGAYREAQNLGTTATNVEQRGAVIFTDPNERQRVEGYLAWKTGNVALLPTGHPYKTVRP